MAKVYLRSKSAPLRTPCNSPPTAQPALPSAANQIRGTRPGKQWSKCDSRAPAQVLRASSYTLLISHHDGAICPAPRGRKDRLSAASSATSIKVRRQLSSSSHRAGAARIRQKAGPACLRPQYGAVQQHEQPDL
ncbi:hypothetical protein NDU88_000399 [Pleurodeles waltl]|uniref:Uncharacterized protein n=1 Tax=Pleurodeles waltl TaxID=8319 RepID=A0AAV7S822_PLEWA|nr:hypothetical protein NDU88_000399 [Pleurodeles waltl]